MVASPLKKKKNVFPLHRLIQPLITVVWAYNLINGISATDRTSDAIAAMTTAATSHSGAARETGGTAKDYENGLLEIAGLKATELRAALKARGLSTIGKRVELQARLGSARLMKLHQQAQQCPASASPPPRKAGPKCA